MDEPVSKTIGRVEFGRRVGTKVEAVVGAKATTVGAEATTVVATVPKSTVEATEVDGVVVVAASPMRVSNR